jgi:hypothetical protein
MRNFELKKFESIVGKQDFYDLKINGLSQYEEFNKIINTDYLAYKTEVFTMFSYMDLVSNLKTLPKTKFREITPKKDNIKEYEIKSKHIRVYLFHVENSGKIVAYWGLKKNQKENIISFRKIKKEYIDQLNK